MVKTFIRSAIFILCFSFYPAVEAQLPSIRETESLPLTNPPASSSPAGVPTELLTPQPIMPREPIDLNLLRQRFPQLEIPPDIPNDDNPSAYRLGAGDLVQVELLETPELNKEVPVLAGGTVNLPLIGPVNLETLTLTEAAQAISRAYLRVLKTAPNVTVSIITPRPFRIGVAGEVVRPGFYTIPLTPGVGVKPAVLYPTLTQALEKAGGVTQASDIAQVEIRRRTSAGQKTIRLNLWNLLKGGDFSQDIVLQDGDGIFVPTVISPNLAQARQLANTSFSPVPDSPRTVSVVGEVNRPGTYVVIGGNTTNDVRTLGLPTVTRTLKLAGGITPLADLRRVQIRRSTSTGLTQTIDVNLWQMLQTGDLSQDTIVQDGDSILIPTAQEINPSEAMDVASANFSPERIRVYIAGEVRTGGTGSYLELPGNAALNQALASGAFGYDNPRARRDKVDLIRLNPDGTVTRKTIEVDLSSRINEQTNPLLRNNDIILVSRKDLTQTSDQVGNVVEPVVKVFPLFNFLGILRSLFGL